MIRNVAWPVQPGSQQNTRPQRLIKELDALGLLDSPAYFYHGRTAESDGHHKVSFMAPARALRGMESAALLSPLFLSGGIEHSKWVDIYDDWSLAPDIHPAQRLMARKGYSALRNEGSQSFLITANSQYMANKIGRSVTILPNGTDKDLWKHKAQGTADARLLILGNFFPGRTDYSLIKRVVNTGSFRQVIFGGIGNDKRMKDTIDSLRAVANVDIVVHDWLSTSQLMEISGEQTVALIPHVVNDYTLSQDLMKAYTFTGLGLPVICPRLLWPPAIPMDNAYLVGHGDNLEKNLAKWVSSRSITNIENRREFCLSNSWEARARVLAEALC